MLVIIVPIVAVLLLIVDRGKKRAPGARSPYKAAAASMLLPGLGQFYNGELRGAFLVWAFDAVFVLLVALAGTWFGFWGMTATIVLGLVIWIAALVDAVRMARARQVYTPKAFNRWYAYVGAFVVAVALSVPVERSKGVRAFKVPAESMEPTLLVGDFFIARLETAESYEDTRGDILVFKYPGDNTAMYIKRVVAFPGEKVDIRGRSILIDGRPIAEPWARMLEQSIRNTNASFGPYTVPDGTLFMLGDNMDNSADSRIWGPLPRDNIVGVAEFVYFSWDAAKRKVRWDRIGTDIDGGD